MGSALKAKSSAWKVWLWQPREMENSVNKDQSRPTASKENLVFWARTGQMESMVIMVPHVKDDVQMPRAQVTEGLLLDYGCQMSDRLNLTVYCNQTIFSLWGQIHNGPMLSPGWLSQWPQMTDNTCISIRLCLTFIWFKSYKSYHLSKQPQISTG